MSGGAPSRLPLAALRAPPRARRRGGRLDRLDPAGSRLDHVDTAAVAGDDAVELGQRLDLVDDDAAHLRGAVRGLLRQLENALAQLAAGRLEFLLHVGGHPFQAFEHVSEAGRGLREHRAQFLGHVSEVGVHLLGRFREVGMCLVGCLREMGMRLVVYLRKHGMHLLGRFVIHALHGLDRTLALFFGPVADGFEGLLDRPGAAGRQFCGQAGDLAGPLRRTFERLIEHAVEAREPILEIAALAIERGNQLFDRCPAFGQAQLASPIADIDQRDRFRERAAVSVELAGNIRQALEGLIGDRVEAGDLPLHLGIRPSRSFVPYHSWRRRSRKLV